MMNEDGSAWVEMWRELKARKAEERKTTLAIGGVIGLLACAVAIVAIHIAGVL